MAQEPLELILFRQLSSSLAIPTFMVDANGDLVYLNEAAEQLLGVRLDEIDEMPFDVWTTAFAARDEGGEETAVESLPLVAAIRNRRPAHGPLTITGGDGVQRRIEITAFPLEGGRGRFIGAVAMFWERTMDE